MSLVPAVSTCANEEATENKAAAAAAKRRALSQIQAGTEKQKVPPFPQLNEACQMHSYHLEDNHLFQKFTFSQ